MKVREVTQASRSRFITNPVPTRLAGVEQEHIDVSRMVKTYLEVPGTDENITIFVYNPADDLWVSGRILNEHLWQDDQVKPLMDLWQAGLRGNYLDVGGNIGTFALPISHMLSKYGSQAIIVEATPDIASHLKASIQINKLDNVALYEYAVSSPDTQDSVQIGVTSHNKGGSSLAGNKDTTGDESVDYFADVGLTTIDSMLDSNPALQKVLAMKMDIEGNEGRAFKGATRFLEEFPPCYLLVELVAEWLEKAGTPCESVKQLLDRAGYDLGEAKEIKCNQDDIMLKQRDMAKCLARCRDA